MPDSLSRDQQLKSVREIFRYPPSVQGENIRPQTRGLQAGVVQNTRVDGLNIAATTDYPVEQFDRIEVLNGLAGALYGPANPAGTFNYVLKRPTRQPFRSVSVGYATESSKLISVDVGDSLGDEKRYGYRVNLLSDRGEGYVDRSRLERTLASVAFDVAITDDTRLELTGSRYHYVANGFPRHVRARERRAVPGSARSGARRLRSAVRRRRQRHEDVQRSGDTRFPSGLARLRRRAPAGQRSRLHRAHQHDYQQHRHVWRDGRDDDVQPGSPGQQHVRAQAVVSRAAGSRTTSCRRTPVSTGIATHQTRPARSRWARRHSPAR